MTALYPERFLKGLVFYGGYHTNPVNVGIHVLCVPSIYFSALVLLQRVPIAVPTIIATALASVGLPAASAALPTAAFYSLYYTYLPGPSLLGFSASALAAGALWGVGAWNSWLGVRAIPVAATVHIACWLAQFYGHGAHEGRAPALLDNLFDALVLAPLFVWTEILMSIGLAKSLHDVVVPRVNKEVGDYRATLTSKDNGKGK